MTTTKKLFAMAILALMPMIQTMAQTIEGKWKMTKESLEAINATPDEGEADIFLAFGQTDVKLIFQIEMSNSDVGTIGFGIELPGEYKVEGNVINNTFNSEKATAEIFKLDLNDEIKKTLEASEEMKALFLKTITSELDKNKPEMIEGVKMIGMGLSTLNIVKNDGTTLTLSANDKTFEMVKVE